MVSFEGTDGDGELKMKVSNDAPDEIDMALVSFHTEIQRQLSEGDIIVIVASGSSYRLGTSTKRYKVEGMECYLKDVNSLDEKQLDSIFAGNESIQTGNVEMALDEDETLQIKPRSLICHNNKTENELYLISEVSFSVTNKKHFTVSKLENVVINSTNGNLVLSYGNNMGNLTSVKSLRSAMLYADYNSAVMAIENEQSSQEEVSMHSFE